jgi:hypothetical protein
MGNDDEQTLADIKARLYALPPDEFTEARDTAAKQAPGPLARSIKALRRPTLSAWLVNLLAAHRPDELDELLSIGEQLRDAHQAPRGQELRELSVRRQAVITSLVALARDLATEHGRTVRDDAAWEAEGTLRAALADADVADLVRAGTLMRPIEYSGLGLPALELTEQLADDAVPVEQPGGRRAKLRVILGGRGSDTAEADERERTRKGPGKAGKAAKAGKAEAGKAATGEAAREAERQERAQRAAAALAEAEQSLEAAVTAEREATRRLGEIAAEFDELRVRERQLRGEQAEADRDRRRAQRRREVAEKAVSDARRRLR